MSQRDWGFRRLMRAARDAAEVACNGGLWGIAAGEDHSAHWYIAIPNSQTVRSLCGQSATLIVKAPGFRTHCTLCQSALISKSVAPAPVNQSEEVRNP